MATLTQCIRRAGKALKAEDASAIRELRDQLRSEGLEESAAAREAVAAQIVAVMAERDAMLSNTSVSPDALPKLAAYTAYETGATETEVDESVEEEAAGYTPDVDTNPAELTAANRLARSQKWKRGRDMKQALQDATRQWAADNGVDLQDNDYLIDRAVEDATEALKNNADAIGWYDRTVSSALRVLARIHPEIATDKESEFAFKYALAVTSNGLKVDKNFELAEKAYSQWKSSGAMPTDIGSGPQGNAMNSAMELFNKLHDEVGAEALRQFMTRKSTVGEIQRASGIDVNGELVNTPAFGAVVIGPKIGNGFLMNLYGEFGQLTMDRWLVSTWGRWSGTLLKDNQKLADKARTRLEKAINALGKRQLETVQELLGDVDMSSPDAVALSVQKATIKPDKRSQLSASPRLNELRKAGNGLAGQLDAQRLTPNSGSERNKIRTVFAGALEQLQADPALKDLTMADLQAVLWYAEKRLYDAAKVDDGALGYEADEAPDYANAAAKLARKLGISDADIKEARDGRAATAGRDTDGLSAQDQQGADRENVGESEGGTSVREDVSEYEGDVSGLYDRIETRPDTNPVQQATGRSAVRDLLRRLVTTVRGREGDTTDGGDAKLLASRIVRDFNASQPGRLIGNTAKTPEDIATLAQIYRDPRFETLRVIFLNGDEVVGESAFTSRMPAAVTFEGGFDTESMQDKMKSLGADGYYLLHNHPSGKSSPSSADVRFTQALDDRVPGFAGHVVIDFNEYSTIMRRGDDLYEETIQKDMGAEDFFAEPEVFDDILGQTITTGPQFEAVARTFADPGRPTIILTNARSKVQFATSISMGMLQSLNEGGNSPRLEASLRALLRETGSGGLAFMVMPERGGPTVGPRNPLRNIITDYINADGTRIGTPAVSARVDQVFRRSAVDLMEEATGRIEGLPRTVTVDGIDVPFGNFEPAMQAARNYMERTGLPYNEVTRYAPVDTTRAQRIAQEFDAMDHAPNDPMVKAAYKAMAEETVEQYREIMKTGLQVRFIKGDDPYGNPRNAIIDIIENNQFLVFSTKDGYGSDETFDVSENPLLAESEFRTEDGDVMLLNDVFRVVHDYFGHAKNGVGFRARGEENAWQSHAAMYSPLARRAMTTETRGQNSWVNFGPNADHNRTASPADTIYADQKVGLLPNWASEDGRDSETDRRNDPRYTEGLEGAVDGSGYVRLTHFSRQSVERTNPRLAGTGLDRKVVGRRTIVEGTWFGITQATESPYRREPGLGQVEQSFSLPATSLYPANADPEGLWVTGDLEATRKKLLEAGFSGWWANNKSLGKVAQVFEPLYSDDSVNEDKATYVRSLTDTENGLYSKMARLIEEAKMPGLAPSKRNPDGGVRGAQWKQYLGARGIKNAEWEWTGMREILNDNMNLRFTKEEMLLMMGQQQVSLGDTVAGSLRGNDSIASISQPDGQLAFPRSLNGIEYSAREFAVTAFGLSSDPDGISLATDEHNYTEDGVQMGYDMWRPEDSTVGILGSQNAGKYVLFEFNPQGGIELLSGPIESFNEAKLRLSRELQAGDEFNNDNRKPLYGQYVLPGEKTGYHEIKITLPKFGDYYSDNRHFDDVNLLAFTRATLRDGGYTYLLEELQSDWHQVGRKKGYRKRTAEEFVKEKARLDKDEEKLLEDMTQDIQSRLQAGDWDGVLTTKAAAKGHLRQMRRAARRKRDPDEYQGPGFARKERVEEEHAAFSPDLQRRIEEHTRDYVELGLESTRPPRAPFEDDAWVSLMAKRALIEAVRRGANKIQWLQGATMEKRWSDEYAELYDNLYNKKLKGIFQRLTKTKPVEVERRSFELGIQELGTNSDKVWEVRIPSSVAEEVGADGLPMFREGAGGGMTVERVRNAIRNLGNVDSLEIYQSVDDLPEAERNRVKRGMRRQGVAGIRGYYNRKSARVVLIADGLRNAKDAQVTVLHEAIGHRGIEAVMGDRINQFYAQVQRARASDPVIERAYEEVDRRYRNARDWVKAAEVVALISEKDPKHTFVQRIMQWFREALREMGFTIPFSNNDIIAALRKARQAESRRSGDDMSFAVETRSPEMQDQVRRLEEGEIDNDEYVRQVQKLMPIQPFLSVPDPATMDEMVGALHSNKQDRATTDTKSIPDGTLVGNRLDIPAYNDHGVWIASIHDGSTTSGKPIAYTPTAVITDVTFTTNPKASLKVAKGSPKATFARMMGKWKGQTPAQAKRRAQLAMKNKDWVQIGMNPERHSYFYDKRDNRPVIAADEVIQVGALVMAKGVKYGKPADEQFRVPGTDVYFSGEETTAFDRWFKGSQIVGDNSEPLKMYHGTAEDFVEFKRGVWPGTINDVGSWFTDNQRDASTFAGRRDGSNVMPVYLSIKNPKHFYSRDELMDAWVEHAGADMYGKNGDAEKFRAWLRSKGHDGMSMGGQEVDGPVSSGGVYVVALDPGQIKSATGNRGTFDPNTSNILFSEGGNVTSLDDAREMVNLKKFRSKMMEEIRSGVANRVALINAMNDAGAYLGFKPGDVFLLTRPNGDTSRFKVLGLTFGNPMKHLDAPPESLLFEHRGKQVTPYLTVEQDGEGQGRLQLSGMYKRAQRIGGGPSEVMFSASDAGSVSFHIENEGWKNAVIRKMQDKFVRLKLIQEQIEEQGGKVDDSNNAYLAEEAFHGKAENDLRNLRNNYIEPMTKKMADLGVTQEELDDYLYAMHAPERNAHIASINDRLPDGGSGMTDIEAGRILARFKNEGKTQALEDVASHVYAMLEEQRRLIVDGQLEDDGTIAAWESKYAHYVPLKGWADDTKSQGKPGAGQGFSIRGPESKRSAGRRSLAASPSSFAINDMTDKILRVRKNEVGLKLLKLAEDNPDENLWEVFSKDDPPKEEKFNSRSGKVEITAINMDNHPDFLPVKRGGEQVFIRIHDELLLRAMKNLGPESIGKLLRAAATYNRFLSSVNTSYSPEFMVSNMLRDVQTAILNLQSEKSLGDKGKVDGEEITAQTLRDMPKSMAAAWRGLRNKGDPANNEFDKWYKEFVEAGAKTGYFDMKDVNEQSDFIEKLVRMSSGTLTGKAELTWEKIATGVENMNGAVENAIRLSAFIQARRAGVSEVKAASLVKNMTVNFNRRGEIGTWLNSLFMFANASIQGTANFARTIVTLKPGDKPWFNRLSNGAKLGLGLTAGAYTLAALNRMMAGEDDDGESWYDKIPAYERERNLIFMKSIFGGEQDGSYWKIPLPYGYNVFAVIGNSIEGAVAGKSPISLSLETVLATLGSFSPIGFQEASTVERMLMKNATPTALKPLIDLSMNENFMGSSIYNENFPGAVPQPESQLGRTNTPGFYKGLAKWANEVSGGNEAVSGRVDFNPDKLAYMVDYTLGSAGVFAFDKVPETVFDAIAGADRPASQKPFVRRVTGQVRPFGDMDNYYDRREKVRQAREGLKDLKGEDLAEHKKKFGHLVPLSGLVKNTDKALKLQRKIREGIYNDESLGRKEKKEKLKEIEDRMETIVDRFNERWLEVQK